LQAERDSIRYEEPPVFARESDAVARTEANLDSLGQQIDELLSAYVAWQQRREQGDLEAAAADSARYFDRLDDFDAGLTGTQLERLLASRAATAGLATASRQPETGAPLDVVVLRAVRTIANRLLP